MSRTTPRRSTVFMALAALGALLMILMFVHASASAVKGAAGRELRARMVTELGLSDLCLFTEARYTRHPSVADLSSAFQDHPLSLEHFPSGSLLSPPQHISSRPVRDAIP